eukprot:201872-Chlamydomonas_euryale.AAC.6
MLWIIVQAHMGGEHKFVLGVLMSMMKLCSACPIICNFIFILSCQFCRPSSTVEVGVGTPQNDEQVTNAPPGQSVGSGRLELDS